MGIPQEAQQLVNLYCAHVLLLCESSTESPSYVEQVQGSVRLAVPGQGTGAASSLGPNPTYWFSPTREVVKNANGVWVAQTHQTHTDATAALEDLVLLKANRWFVHCGVPKQVQQHHDVQAYLEAKEITSLHNRFEVMDCGSDNEQLAREFAKEILLPRYLALLEAGWKKGKKNSQVLVEQYTQFIKEMFALKEEIVETCQRTEPPTHFRGKPLLNYTEVWEKYLPDHQRT
jgi:hypothetical protein